MTERLERAERYNRIHKTDHIHASLSRNTFGDFISLTRQVQQLFEALRVIDSAIVVESALNSLIIVVGVLLRL